MPRGRFKFLVLLCSAQKVYEGGWEAKTDDQLISRIKLYREPNEEGQGKSEIKWSEWSIFLREK